MRDSKPILLLEDDTVDAMTVKRALKDIKVTNQLVRTANGEETAFFNAHLTGSARFSPYLSLSPVDLNSRNRQWCQELLAARFCMQGGSRPNATVDIPLCVTL